MTYNRAEDVPPDVQHDLFAGVVTGARKLREWRAFGEFHELRGSWLSADGEVVLICHHDDSVTLVDGCESMDLTALLDAA